MVPLPPCPRPQKTLWSPWAALSPEAPLPGHRPCLVGLLWAPKQDDRRESSPALERRRGGARPSGGCGKAPLSRPAPGGLAHPLACGLTLPLAAPAFSWPPAPLSFPGDPAPALSARGYFLGETSSSAACLGVRPPSLVGSPHGSWGSAALGAGAAPCLALLARGRACSVTVSLIVWSQLRWVTESGCAVWVVARPRAAAAPSWSCSLHLGPKHQWPSPPPPTPRGDGKVLR